MQMAGFRGVTIKPLTHINMSNYAIKTKQGYLAVQGDTHWFEETPRGWALFTTEESARNTAQSNHSNIGTKPDEGYTIETIAPTGPPTLEDIDDLKNDCDKLRYKMEELQARSDNYLAGILGDAAGCFHEIRDYLSAADTEIEG